MSNLFPLRPALSPALMAPSKSTTQKPMPNGTAAAPNIPAGGEPAVNRKKQKKRQKQAARLATEQSASPSGSEAKAHLHLQNGETTHLSAARDTNDPTPDPPATADYLSAGYDDTYESRDGEDMFYSEDDSHE